ncbi:maleylpyruvate isomerase family mycothiol-dependent enzyme [Streptomyces californicus]|uniref:maleylpyruvate isomerase family mycothiol-dependent enzyme n=1 Tax=Streptomyces californicus TaxID=67351 RepID=UPI00296FD814|nr:maleylpyruvate isomerase family mycothiol-dependent enzyme [Streptomyces californicus]MDW4903033.1 maleylpyruvate isomerase family mycothiol-dependent enzyme [Streptomyces californicus]
MAEPQASESRKALERAIHVERLALAHDLTELSEAQWAKTSLCERWTVEEVVAHLTAGASTRMWRWLLSMLAARFDPDLHNDRRLAEHRGATPEETLRRFRDVVAGPAGPTGHTAAWLGEIVVHSEDIRRPLGLVRTPPVPTTTAVARFFASRDFTVPSKTATAGLRLEATDGPFTSGSGNLLRGPTLSLVMGMAGRAAAREDLEGDGAAVLRARLHAGQKRS